MNQKENKSYFITTMGCPKNEVDSEAIEYNLLGAGFKATDDIKHADLVMLNSCAFINDAKIETIDSIFELHRERKKGSILVVCGCLPARYQMENLMPEVDIFLPSGQHHSLLEKLREKGLTKRHADPGRIQRLNLDRPYAYLKITDGCDNCCSYCAIPQIKGPLCSRPSKDIIIEANYLQNSGVRELVLIGQDITSYGRDSGESFAALLLKLDAKTKFDWIRLMYLHPAYLSEEIIETIAESSRIIKYIDLPLQHINDRILKLMNRKTDKIYIEELIAKLRNRMPHLTIRTTFIVGFPGESDDDFGELLDFCEKTRFDHVGIFRYSPEEGTTAYDMKFRVNSEIIEERYLALLDLQNRIANEKMASKIGNIEKVLVNSVENSRSGLARAAFQAPEIDGNIIIENCHARPGQFTNVLIGRAEAYDLFAHEIGEDKTE